jgi:Platelet-activating factor acetylhydrolase, isoform II
MNTTLRTRTFSARSPGVTRFSPWLAVLALGSTLLHMGCEDNDARFAQLSESSQPLDAAQLPAPAAERFSVGTSAYQWVDRARAEELTPEADDVRTLVVRAWYPADATSAPARAPYFLNPLQGQLNAQLGGLAPDAFSAFELAARVDAPLLEGTRQFPVLVFSPGLSTPLEYYGYQLSDLASRGYVIFALSHPYSTGLVVFSDGRIAPELAEESLPERRDSSVATWSLDQRFALSEIERLAAPGSQDRMAGRLDFGRVGVFGHSRGGAAAAESCFLDARFRACANLDGSISTLLHTNAPPQPFLLMRSEVVEPTLDAFFTRLPGRAHRVFVTTAGHNSYSDLPRLVEDLQLPVDREALLLGTLASERAFEINAAYLSAFFGVELLGASTPLWSEPSPFAEVKVTNQQQP